MIGDAIDRWAAAIDAGQRPVMLAGSNDARRPAQPGRHRPRCVERGVLADRRRRCTAAPATRSGPGSRCGATATANAPSTAALVDVANGQLGTVVAVDGGPAHRAPRPATPTSTSSWTTATSPAADRSATATPSPPTAPRAAPGTCRSPSASTASTGKPPTPTCPAASPRTGSSSPTPTSPGSPPKPTPTSTATTPASTPTTDVDVDEDLIERLSTSRAKHLAHSVDPDDDRVDAPRPHPAARRPRRAARASPAGPPGSPPSSTASTATSSPSSSPPLDHTARHAAVGRAGQGPRPAQHRHHQRRRRPRRHGPRRVRLRRRHDRRARPRLATGRDPRRDVAARDLPPTPPTRCSATRSRASSSSCTAWTDTVIALGSDVDEVTILQRAVDQHVAIGADQLAGDPTRLARTTSSDPARPTRSATPRWDDLVADIVRWRHRHHASPSDGLGPVPDDPDARPAMARPSATRCAATRRWLANTDRHATDLAGRAQPPRTRRNATTSSTPSSTPHPPTPAPSSTPPAAASSPSPTSTRSSATPATPAHARKHWILEHWPHVVEYAEISTTLRRPDLGTRPRRSVRRHRRPTTSATTLAAAIDSRPAVAAGRARRASTPTTTPRSTTTRSTGSTTSPSTATTHHITGRDPLGAGTDRHRRPRRVPGSPRRPRRHPGAAGARAGRPGPRRRRSSCSPGLKLLWAARIAGTPLADLRTRRVGRRDTLRPCPWP